MNESMKNFSQRDLAQFGMVKKRINNNGQEISHLVLFTQPPETHTKLTGLFTVLKEYYKLIFCSCLQSDTKIDTVYRASVVKIFL